MQPLPTGEPVWDLQFDEDGKLTSPGQGSFLAEVAAAGVTVLAPTVTLELVFAVKTPPASVAA